MENIWEKSFSKRTQNMQSSAIRELLKISNLPGVISFAGGLPCPSVFPIEEFRSACEKVLLENGDEALQYSTTEGNLQLRELICKFSASFGIKTAVENTLITNGSQQALDLIGKVFIDSGDKILVEGPTYLGAIQAWKVYGAQFITVETDDYGMIPESLEEKMAEDPKLLYLLPNFQNPTGCTLSMERREKILEIVTRYNIPVIEDDPYGQLRFEGEDLPTVLTLDGKHRGTRGEAYDGNIIYLSTFSKVLAPGLRLAWVIAPKNVIFKLVQAKQGSDLHTSTFSQMIAYEVAKDGFLEKHVGVIRDVYRRRRDLMLEMIDEMFPEEASYIRPEGGLFFWVRAPEKINTEEMLPKAVEAKVAYVPGSPFYANGGGPNTMRLNFSNASEE
ncbi:MAG: PLP-dependent aminotransferase family protein, partial [Chloroflexota bacterium]